MFIQPAAAGTLAEPGLRTEMTNLARVGIAPFDLQEKTWGIAALNVQDNMIDLDAENADEQQLIIVPIGDVEFENAVWPEFDDDGQLLIDEDHPAPMQVSFLRNGYDKPECEEAVPPLLLVQGPKDAPVDIRVNGVDIRVGSTVVLQVLPPGNAMRLMTFFGMATISPDTIGALLVPPGFYATVCLDDPADHGGLDEEDNDQIPSCPWSDPLPITQGDLDDLASLEDLPENILNYPIDLPEIIQASGVGQPVTQFVFTDPDALLAAQEACQAGELSEQICRYLF
jgi:hypothetical protein